ncbi:hypothetical protein ABZ725_51620 [Streptomyces sp. NPDC006872]|uniref:hypothetical protein n=1 Tax=Streptomyces sp. NPDC006872 TaxID=3155720 RepID=UPI0033EEECB9
MTAPVLPGQLVVAAAVVSIVVLMCIAVALLIVAVDRTVQWVRRRAADRRARQVLEEARRHLDSFSATDPEVVAGLARLRAAVRDEQRGEWS